MGKNHRHKKDLKAEKAKVKLKQTKTKFLPKGQNVTNTSFKIKAIVLPEQLKSRDSEEILSKRKLNVKDLLSRLKHYNENVKHSACQELSEMVKLHPDELTQQSFSDICLTVSSLMQDKEHKVRKAATKVIDSLLENIPKEKLEPFFNFFATNLRCAMTNINRSIQEDSLLFLDCFIKNDCGLIVKTSDKLLPDFFSLISKMRTDSSLGRTLTLNLGSKMTSVAWRIKVLSRLHAILGMLLEKEVVSSGLGDSSNPVENELTVKDNFYFPIYKENFEKNLEIDSSNIFAAKSSLYGKEGSILNKHIVDMIPLLYETWCEVMPEQQRQKMETENTILNEETASLLSCIMHTLYLLWQYVSKSGTSAINMEAIFMSTEGKKFLTHLLANFPYLQPSNRPKQKSQKAKNNLKILDFNHDPKCVQENLLICFLYSVLFVNYSKKDLKKELGSIVEYLTKICFQKYSLNQETSQCITEFLAECLGKNYLKWRQSGADLNTILESAILFYDHGRIGEEKKLKIFEILSNVIDNQHLSQSPKYKDWLSSLPNLLCQELLSDKLISSLLYLSQKNSVDFHTALTTNLQNILSNLDNLKIVVTDVSNEELAKRNLVSIFYFVSKYTNSELKIFEHYIQNSDSEDFKRHFQQMFRLRFDLGRQHVVPSFCK